MNKMDREYREKLKNFREQKRGEILDLDRRTSFGSVGDIMDSTTANIEQKEERIEHICPLSLCSNKEISEPCLGSKCGWYFEDRSRCAIFIIAKFLTRI